MKRRSEHLVQKRDGRLEFLRATKLARSIHLALCSVGVDEDWRALEVTTAVLAGLRHRQQNGSAAPAGAAPEHDGAAAAPAARASLLTTGDIAAAVQHVLVATGQPAAAVAFDAVATERRRRRSVLAAAERGAALLAEGPAAAAQLPGVDLPVRRRWPGE